MLDKKDPMHELLSQIAGKAISKLNSQPFIFIILYFLMLIMAIGVRPELFEQLKTIWLILGVVTLIIDVVRLYVVQNTSRTKKGQIDIVAEKPLDGSFQDKNNTSVLRESKSIIELEQQYLYKLHASCQSVVLGGIDPHASDPRQNHIELRGVYTDLVTTELAINDNGKKSKDFFSEAIRVSALRAINDHQYVVLLGTPGSGKSTLINFIALCLSGERLYKSSQDHDWINQLKSYDTQWRHGALLPIRISLNKIERDYLNKKDDKYSHESFLNLITQEIGQKEFSETENHLTEMLNTGNVIFLIDGLDEILNPEIRGQVASSINKFVQQFPAVRYIVTCRSAVYPRQEGKLNAPWYLTGFNVVTLDDFEENQISQFIDSWYKELARINRITVDLVHLKANQLKEKISSTPHIYKLAGKPLLLTVMVILFDHGGGLPEQKAKLYDQCFELLLWKWEIIRRGTLNPESSKSSDVLTQLGVSGIIRRSEIERALCKVVFNSYSKYIPIENNERNDNSYKGIKSTDFLNEFQEMFEVAGFSEKDATEKAKELVGYLQERAGIFMPTDDNILAPLHLSFQEYLAARHICAQRKFTVIIVDLVFQQYEMWREVFIMAIAQKCLQDLYHEAIDAINRLLTLEVSSSAMKNNLLILAGESLREIGPMSLNKDLAGKPLLGKVRKSLLELSQFTSPFSTFDRIDVGYLLGELGDPRLETKSVHEVKVVLPDCVLIPSGLFEMGSNKYEPDSAEDEYSQSTDYKRHLVSLDEYYISKYLVTEFEYELFVRDTGHHAPKHWSNFRPKDGTSNIPVTNVSWFDAADYCNWLQKQMVNAKILKSSFVVRLPTEAEWEKAARWDPQEQKSYVYPWGDEWRDDFCNCLDAGVFRCSPIGVFPKNTFGLFDVSGNVTEWCNSTLAEYPYLIDDMREAFYQPAHKLRAAKGGSWNSHRRFVRCAFRSGLVPEAGSSTFGFRIVIGYPLR